MQSTKSFEKTVRISFYPQSRERLMLNTKAGQSDHIQTKNFCSRTKLPKGEWKGRSQSRRKYL